MRLTTDVEFKKQRDLYGDDLFILDGKNEGHNPPFFTIFADEDFGLLFSMGYPEPLKFRNLCFKASSNNALVNNGCAIEFENVTFDGYQGNPDSSVVDECSLIVNHPEATESKIMLKNVTFTNCIAPTGIIHNMKSTDDTMTSGTVELSGEIKFENSHTIGATSTNGGATSTNGGAIYNAGTLLVGYYDKCNLSYDETQGELVYETIRETPGANVSGGYSTGNGGIIYNAAGGTVEIVDSNFTGLNLPDPDNGFELVNDGVSAVRGGAIYNAASDGDSLAGQVTITGATTFSNFKTSKNGAAIYNDVGATVGATYAGEGIAFSNNTTSKSGAAVCNYGTFTANNFTFFGNTAERFGGAYFGCGDATFTDCTFTDNTALTGGAVYSETQSDLYAAGANADFTNCNFSGNEATGTNAADGLGNGGAIANWGTAAITYGNLNSNEAKYHGGAIVNGIGATLTVTRTLFESNRAGTIGQEGTYAKLGYGGAINNLGELTLTSATFTNNTATQNGGAIASSGTLTFYGTADDAATSFSANKAGYYGTESVSDVKTFYGGAVVSTGELNFNAANLTVFRDNTISGNEQRQRGLDFANGANAYNVTNRTNVDCADQTKIYNYTYVVETQQDSYVVLEAPLESSYSSAVLYDLDGSGVYQEASFLDASNFSVGANVVKRRVVGAYGSVSDSEMILNVVKALPAVEVVAESIADGEILRLSLAVASPVAVKTWRIAWGDGTTDEYSNLSTVLAAAHHYVRTAEDARYNVTLELVDVDGFNAGNVYELDSHFVAAAPASLAVLEVADVALVLPVLKAIANPLDVALPQAEVVGPEAAPYAERAVVFNDYADEEPSEEFAFLSADQLNSKEKNRFDFDSLETELDVFL